MFTRIKKFFAPLILCAFISACATPPEEGSVAGGYLTGRFAGNNNAVGDAADAFEDLRATGAMDDDVLRSAFFYRLASGDVDGAAKLSADILANEEAGDDDLARVVLAAQLIKAQNYAGARDALKPGASTPSFGPLLTLLDAWAADGAEGPETALKLLAQGGDDTFRGFNPLHQAWLFEEAGLDEEARTAYQLSLMTYGGAVAREAYGAFLERKGDLAAARSHYELLAQYSGPDRQVAIKGLGRLDDRRPIHGRLAMTPQHGAAAALYSFGSVILQQTMEQRTAAEEAGFRVGDINYDMPLALAQAALYLDPKFDHAQRLAGSILNVYGDNTGAIAMLKRIPADSAFYEQAQLEISVGLSDLGRDNEALTVLRAAARRPGASEAQFALANFLAGKNRNGEAINVFNKLIAGLPETPPQDAWRFYLARAISYLAEDRWPPAESDLKRAVEIAPKEPTALNYLGYSWAERGENLEEAFKLIEQAVAIEPNSGAYIDSLGWAYYQRGDYETAVGHLEQAASLEPGDPTVTDHLGDVYWRLGREIEARYQWRHVLDLEPGDDLRASVEEKIEGGLPEGDE